MNEKDTIKKLENIINNLSLVVGMYLSDYHFDDDHKVKHQMLINYAHLAIGTPINGRGMARYVGVEYVGDDLVELIITEEEAIHTADILFYSIDKCNYPSEIEQALIKVKNQIINQIDYEPIKGI